jgi:hypothetical protein
MTELLNTKLRNGIKVIVKYNGSQYFIETTFNGLTQVAVSTRAIDIFYQINEIQHFLPTVSKYNKVKEEQTPDPAADVKPVFVEANVRELLEAINNGEQAQYYIYNPKKGTMVSVPRETNLHQVIVHQILRKVGK